MGIATVSAMGHLLGYARVSTTDQDASLQIDALNAAGCYRVFVDTISGSLDHRPELEKLLDQLRQNARHITAQVTHYSEWGTHPDGLVWGTGGSATLAPWRRRRGSGGISADCRVRAMYGQAIVVSS